MVSGEMTSRFYLWIASTAGWQGEGAERGAKCHLKHEAWLTHFSGGMGWSCAIGALVRLSAFSEIPMKNSLDLLNSTYRDLQHP